MNLKSCQTVRTVLMDRVEYRLHGKLHREDGPAIEYTNGFKQWWLDGKRITEEAFFDATELAV